jgi:hypothetical protein
MKKRARADSQITELQGRGRLIGELLVAGLEVAVPARDRGVDILISCTQTILQANHSVAENQA